MFTLLLGVQVWDIVERLPRLEWPLDYYFLLVLQMVTNDTAREGPACFKHDWLIIWKADLQKETLVRAALGRSLPAGWEKCSFLSAQRWWDTSGVQSPAQCCPVKGDMGILEWVQQRWRKVHWDWDMRHLRRGWANWICSAGRREGSLGDHFNVYKHLMGWWKEGGTRVFSVLLRERKKGHGKKWKYGKYRIIQIIFRGF